MLPTTVLEKQPARLVGMTSQLAGGSVFNAERQLETRKRRTGMTPEIR